MIERSLFQRKQICAGVIFCLFLAMLPVNGKAEEAVGAYRGFSGIYQRICIDGKTVRQSGDKFILSKEPASDGSDLFLPRYMGDGSYAFENKKTERRIAEAELGEPLSAALYRIRRSRPAQPDDFAGLDDDTQHWILEEKAGTKSYCLKSLGHGRYMGAAESGGELAAVEAPHKAEISFQPAYEESPLYLLSQQPGYDTLPEKQRAQIEGVYESVAGDVFETCGPYDSGKKQTPRAAIDRYYDTQIKGKHMTASQFHDSIARQFNNSAGFAYVLPHINQGYNVRMDLPGTEGASYRFYPIGDPYTDAFEGTQRVNYRLEVYDRDDDGRTRVQTIRALVQDTYIGRKNAETFCEVMQRLPYALRQNIHAVTSLESGKGQYLCDGTNIDIYLKRTPTADEMTEAIVHELGHSLDVAYSDGSRWSMGGEWTAAMAADCYGTSAYARENNKEDFAEFCRIYFTGYTKQDWRRAVMILFPERYRLFKRVRMKVMDGYSLWDDGELDKELTVYFDYNDDGQTPVLPKTAMQYARYNEIMPAEPTRPEREFLGWYTQNAGGKEVTGQQRIIDDTNHTLYAHWSDPPGEEITIHFDPDNGDDELVITVRKNTRIKEVIPDPVRKEYQFFGWCTTGGFSERFDPVRDVVLFDGDEVYLKAQWNALPHTIVLPQGASGAATYWRVEFQGLAPCTIILAGYQDGVLVEMESKNFGAAESWGEFTMNQAFDTLKVMTWSSLDGMRPLYESIQR